MRASVSGTVILLDMSDMHILLYPKILVSGGNILIYKQLLEVWPFLCTNNTAFFVAVVLAATVFSVTGKTLFDLKRISKIRTEDILSGNIAATVAVKNICSFFVGQKRPNTKKLLPRQYISSLNQIFSIHTTTYVTYSHQHNL